MLFFLASLLILMRAALLFLASLLASAKAVGRSQKATKQAMNVDEDDEPDICADEEAPMTETMLSTCVTPAASHGVPQPVACPACLTLQRNSDALA